MVIKTKRFYVNSKSCKVELKKEGADYLVVVDGNVCMQRLRTNCMRCRNLMRFKKARNRYD